MNLGKHARSIRLLCSTCGGAEFEFSEGDGPVRCVSCDRSFPRDELIRENGEIIDENVQLMANDVAQDFTKALRESMRKAFSGSKHFKIRL